MSDRAERITNLLALLLEARVPLTADQIFNELAGQYPAGTTARRQAFERDKAMLRDLGVPIDTEIQAGSDAGRTTYSIDKRRYELAGLELDADEQQALQLAVAAIRSGTGFGTDALIKLGAGSVDAELTVTANVPSVHSLPELREAIAARHPVGFLYRDRARRVDPYGLLLRSGFWYLVGHDHGHGEPRTFRVDRIGGSVEIDERGSFERPDLDVAAFFPADSRQLSIGADEPAAVTAIVRLDGVRAEALERDLGAERVATADDGVVEVEVPATNPNAFRSWVLGFLDRAEVISPAERRHDVVSWLEGMIAATDSRRGGVTPSALDALRGRPRRGGPSAATTAEARVRRMLLMLPWLTARGEVALDEVARRFDLTPEQVEADITWVSMCGLPPYVDEMIDVFVDDGAVHVGVPRLFARPLRLTAPEAFALLTAGRAAMELPGADPGGALARGLGKLAEVLGDDASGVTLELRPPAAADDLADAVRRVERLELDYWSPVRDTVSPREVTPRRVFSDRGFWYLRADDHTSGESRTFRLDRIEHYRRLGVFDDPVDDGESGDDSTWFSDAAVPRVTLWLDEPAFWVAERYPVDAVSDVDGADAPARLVRLPVSSERWLERLLVRLGNLASVVEPDEWRPLGVDAAQRILRRYGR
jgi:predicted DNA-binding transcriptional regulator YafY